MRDATNTEHDAQANTASAAHTRVRRTADWLRYIPPAAALGTAFVLQVILVTDTVGTALANRDQSADWNWAWYLFALLLGLAVASCVEGGAAYLMDLYDKHLIARDSVLFLRLGMLVYVGGSAAAVHWWAGERELPEVISWILGGMSASALFLWSRGSRWQHRAEMRAAGQLDPALPRLSLAAKGLHPIRWLITLYLVSWRPVRTTDEARARYDGWRAGPHWWSRPPRPTATANIAITPAGTDGEQTKPNTAPGAEPEQSSRLDRTVVSINGANRTRRRSAGQSNNGARPTVEQMADTIRRVHGARSIGRPNAEQILRREYGTCQSKDAQAAKDVHNARLEQRETQTSGGETADDTKEDARVDLGA